MIITISICVAFFLAEFGVANYLLDFFQGYKFIAAFLAGMFFISIFTVTPAMAFILELFKTQPILETTFFCALGWMVGDFIVYRFIKDSLAEDVAYLLKFTGHKKILAFSHRKFFHWFVPLIGSIIIASPFPDEIGLTMLGLSKTKTKFFLPLAFVLDFLGILVIGLIISKI